jgi:hypothetical protein
MRAVDYLAAMTMAAVVAGLVVLTTHELLIITG